ncbi:TPA: hypothetical protein ACH3X2_011689 [Trebouxia sp. C0005]
MLCSRKTLTQNCRPLRPRSAVLIRAVAQVSGLDKHTAAIRSSKRRQCDVIRWNLDEDGPFSEDAAYSKMRKLGHDHFSEFFKVNLEGSVGAKFPFHAHGDASLEMQMVGSSRYFFPNQDPVSMGHSRLSQGQGWRPLRGVFDGGAGSSCCKQGSCL